MGSTSGTPNPWMGRGTLNYAHRGGALEAPSNTIYAMRQALANRADALEMDVHADADGELIVCHDHTVDATTNGRGVIAEMHTSELMQLDAAYWWVEGEAEPTDRAEEAYLLRGLAPARADLRPARLRDVLEVFAGVPLNLDIKRTAPATKPYERELAAMLESYGRTDDVIVTSFHDAALEGFAAAASGVGMAPGPSGLYRFWQSVTEGTALGSFPYVALQVPVSFAGRRVVDRRFVEAAHQVSLAVHVWTINDTGEMAEMIGLGVDGIMTDRPGALAKLL
jgi:glycerophosphoryl diester phosphodiesterase